MKSRLNKFLAFALVLITIFSLAPNMIFAGDTSTVKVLAYDENSNLIKEYSKKVVNNAMADLTDVKTEIANDGYVVVGLYSEFKDGKFENKLTDNSIYVSSNVTVYAQVYKDDNSKTDLDNIAYNFGIFFNKKQSVVSVGYRYYNLTDFIKEVEKQGYKYEAAYGDSAYTDKIPNDTCIDLEKYPKIYVKARGVKFYCVSSSGLSKYNFYVPLKEGATLKDIDNMLLGSFKNGDQLTVKHYLDETHKKPITDISYFNDYAEGTIPCYSVAYYKSNGPVTEKTYKVSFNLNTPDGKSATGPSAFNAKSGHVATLETPKCDGYSFIGWYDGDKKVDIKYTVSKNVTLVAHWTEKKNEDKKEDDKKDESKVEDKKPESSKQESTSKEETKVENTQNSSTESSEKPATSEVETKTENPVLIIWRSSTIINKYKSV